MAKRNKNGVDNKLTKKQNNDIKYNINIFKKDYDIFEITFPFIKDILLVCRDIPGRIYNLENNSWTYPIQQYTSLIQKLKSKKDVIIEKDLTEEEIQYIQVVELGDDEDLFYYSIS
jgi:hypothetical protein